MAFNLQARTVIESATLELNAQQLQDLAGAAPVLQELLDEIMSTDTSNALKPVTMLLNSIASLVNQTGVIKPKRTIKRKKANPTAGKPG